MVGKIVSRVKGVESIFEHKLRSLKYLKEAYKICILRKKEGRINILKLNYEFLTSLLCENFM